MTIEPRCLSCHHFNEGGVFTCRAFPGGIPDEILMNDEPHNQVLEGQEGSFTYTGSQRTPNPPEPMLRG